MKKLLALLTFLAVSLPGNAWAGQPVVLYDAFGHPIGSTLNAGQWFLNVDAALVEAATAANGAASPALGKVTMGVDGGGLTRFLLTDTAGKLQTAAVASLADGADVTEGAKADAAATDSTSSWTVVAILKGLWAKLATTNTNLTTINTTLGTPFQAGGTLGAGAAIIGKVSIDQTTPGTTNLVSIGTNGTVQEKAPLNSTGSGSAAGVTVSTVITLTAPANAVKAYLMNLDTSTANIRWAVNRTATTTLGQQLQPGRDVVIDTAHDISIVSESGTQNYDVQWISQ